MNTPQEVGQVGRESAANSAASSEDAQSSSLRLVTPITQTGLGIAGAEVLKPHAEGASLLSSTSGEVYTTPPSSDSHTSAIGGATASHKASSVLEETVHSVESSAGNSVGDTGSAEVIKDKAQAQVLAKLRAIFFVCAVKLPIVGSYFVGAKRDGPNADTSATETTPLLVALQDPKAFATGRAEGLLFRLFSPVLHCIPDVDALDNAESNSHGLLFTTFVEFYAPARNGGGWLFTHLQEHSLVIAPIISLGHLSTTDLAASTIGTTVTSITGYSIIQGFTSSLDRVLTSAPNHHTAKLACAQVAFVTGIALLPIASIWSFHSAALLQRLGQQPEVANPASEFLQVSAAGLPGYAIGEIAKRYLMSQGLSNVHTNILSVIAPLNLLLNYILVNGPIPALRLGFAGAPLCTVLSHNALAVMSIIYIVQRAIRQEVEYLRKQNIVPDEPHANTDSPPEGGEVSPNHSEATFFTGFGALVLAGVSGVLKSASQLWSKDFVGAVASILGPDALATQAVVLATVTTLYQVPKSLGNASSDRIKKWIAKGDVERAKIAAFVAFFSTFAGLFVISNVLLAFATSWGKLFNNDPSIVENVSALLPIIAIFQAVHGIGAWADSTLGALGRTAVFPSVNASADYLFGFPLGVYLTLMRGWGLSGLWIGLTISLAYSCLVAMIVLVWTNWRSAVHSGGENYPGANSTLSIRVG